MGAAALVLSQLVSGLSVGFTGPLVAAAAAAGPTGHPNLFNPGAPTSRPNHLPKPPTSNIPKPTFSQPKGPAPVPMRPALVALDPVKGAHFLGSDGALELTVPPGAVTAGDVQAAGGSLNLLVRQVEPGSGSSAGGSGHVSFGTWLVQVVDGSGRLAARGLRHSLEVKLHESRRAGAVDLAHSQVLVNPSLPSWVSLDPGPTAAQVAQAAGTPLRAPTGGAAPAKPALGPASHQAAALDAATTTLAAAVPMSSPSTAMTFGTDAPVATFGRPDPFETNLSGGSLSAGIPLDVPAGPGGLTPPLTLSYTSASVTDQHSPQGAAPWVGEGWSLGLGAISWAEHQVDMTGCQQCTSVQWEDSWQLSDPFGTAADLVPPDVNVSTYQDDSGNPITASPITWHTAPETRARVISYGNPNPPFAGPVPPCFRVFLPNGIMEEFGCTADSLQWYTQTSGANAGKYYLANWLLDLITDPQGNQIHVTYQRDVETGNGANLYPRDAVLATVEYDSTGCHDPQVMCTGSSWVPLMRVNFAAAHSVAHGSGCAANGNLRCDDPADLSGSGGVAAPIVQSVFVLNDAQVQVRASGSGSWNTLRDYQFSYSQTGPSTITDPMSGTQESVAGSLLLTGLQVIGSDGATSLPARTFGYAQVTQYYEDVTKSPLPSTNCGPSWNNGQKPNINLGCVLWSQSYAANSSYLSTVSNGLGLSEAFTWQLARNNFYGAPGGSSPADPMVCDNTSVQSSFPCNMPDNQTWSRAVLTQRTDSVLRTAGNPVTSTWTYAYQVQYPLAAQECSGCVASFYWGNQNDFDEQDFYNNKFMGFAQASVQNPDNGVEVHKFLTTQGFGIYDTSQSALVCNTPAPCHSDPYWALGNAAHGHEYELDQYATDGTTLLKQMKTQWSAVCPPPGVSGTPANPNWGNWDGDLVTELDHSNPVMVCEVQRQQVDSLTYDGATQGPVPDQMTTYTYDSYGRKASQSTVNTTGVFDSSGHGNHAVWSGGVNFGAPGLVTGDSDTAATFDGSTGSMITPVVNQQVLTVEAWFELSSLPSGSNPRLVASSHTDVDSKGFQMEINSGGASGFVDVATTNGVFAAPWTQQLSTGTPYHYVMTYDGGTLRAYLNGTSVGSASATGAVVPSQLPVTIGRDPAYSFTDWFGGTLGEVAVYSTALTMARVQAHFNAGSGYEAAVMTDSPLAYYRLNDGTVGTSAGPNTILNKPQYIQDNNVTATSTSATGRYLIDYPAFDDVEDPSGNRYQCSYSSYDNQPFKMGDSTTLTLGEKTTADRYTDCGNSGNGFFPSGQIRTTQTFDPFGNLVTSSDPDANAGVAGHTGCTVSNLSYSSCTTYDGTFDTLPTSSANALNQTATTAYPAPSATAPAVVQDGSGHGYNATPGTAVTFGSAGLVSGDQDTAMSFNGTTASTVNLDLPSVDTTSGHQVTVELWLKYSGSFGMPFGFNRYDLWLDSSGLGFNTAGGDNYGVALSAVPTNTPVHVVAVFTNGSVTSNQLYINGVAQTLSQLRGTPSSQTATPRANISGWGRDSGNRFNGALGKVAIYNGALSAARVQAHFSAGSGYNAAVLADSPIAYYRLNDTAAQGGFGLWPTSTTDANSGTTNVTYDALGRETSRTLPVTTIADSSGHGYNGVPHGALTYGAQGMTYTGDPDGAITFPGVGTVANVSVSLPTVDTTAGHQVTVEFWMMWNGVGGSGMPFGFNSYDLYFENGIGFGFNTGNSDLYGVGMSAIPANTPLHVAAVFTNGGPVTSNLLYINGVAQTMTQLQGAFRAESATANASISSLGSSNHYVFPGTLDEVAVYNGALSATRVQAHFNAQTSYKSAVLADSPLAYYRLDEDSRPATQTSTYTVWCAAGAQTPCAEVDKTQRLNSTTTTTSRSFYDGLGRLVETRSPAPGGQDVIRYAVYDAAQRLAFQSVPYFVAAYTGPPGSAAYSTPDSTQPGTIYDGMLNGVTAGKYDGLGRLLVSTDALSHTSTTAYSVVCAPAGTGDPGCFEQTLSVDPNGHQGGVLMDGVGRKAYVQRYTGNSTSTYALYATAKYTYDFAGDLVRIVQPDGTTTSTFGYDMAGRKTSMSDPDLGGQSYTYDQDGSLTESIDARGGAGTIFMGYDGLDRPIWRNTTNTPTGAYDTYTYDSTANGDVGIGHLTGETFATGSLSGSDAYAYDPRGQQTSSTLTVGGASYPLGSTYDDAGNVLARTYPDGETITNSYTAQGWLSGVATSQGSTTLASNLTYGANGGAFGEITSASIGNGTYTYSATYDLLDRATDLKTTKTSGGTVMFDQSRAFDGAGNVTTIATTMPGATDNQSFCYDEQDRMTWASAATATPPCGGSNTAGTLTAAQYTQTFGYDVLGRLTGGPLGAYTYGDPAHVHAVTGIGTAWTSAYDAAGNTTCRAPSSATTCAGTQTGAQLGYNNEGELQSWQNAPSSPTTTAQFLYDGQGQRVEQSVIQSGTTTATVYVGDVEEISTSGGTTTTTAYYYASAKRIGLSVNGTISYLASDALRSDAVTLNGSGTATAAQLFAPYGTLRYSSGTMATSYGFTGQHADSVSGLDYYNARYYDPVAGQFTSADSVVPGGGFDLWGLSRYAYVEGNPEDRTDPTGHINVYMGDDGSAVPIENAFQGTYSWGSSPVVTYHRGFTRAYPAARSRYQRWSAPKPTPAPRPRPAQAAQSQPHPTPSLAKASNTPLPGRIGDIPNTDHWDYNDPTQAPGPGWEWRGGPGSVPGDDKGGWVDPNGDPDISLHPDLGHGGQKGPHWDVNKRGFPKGTLGPDGTIQWPQSPSDGGMDVVKYSIIGMAAVGVVGIGVVAGPYLVIAAPAGGALILSGAQE